jgi:hypothetical protein
MPNEWCDHPVQGHHLERYYQAYEAALVSRDELAMVAEKLEAARQLLCLDPRVHLGVTRQGGASHLSYPESAGRFSSARPGR